MGAMDMALVRRPQAPTTTAPGQPIHGALPMPPTTGGPTPEQYQIAAQQAAQFGGPFSAPASQTLSRAATTLGNLQSGPTYPKLPGVTAGQPVELTPTAQGGWSINGQNFSYPWAQVVGGLMGTYGAPSGAPAGTPGGNASPSAPGQLGTYAAPGGAQPGQQGTYAAPGAASTSGGIQGAQPDVYWQPGQSFNIGSVGQ